MKTKTIILIICGVLFGCCGVCGLGGYLAFQAGKSTRAEARVAADLILKDVLKDWNFDKLYAASNDRFKSLTEPTAGRRFMALQQVRFGPLIKLSEPTGVGYSTKREPGGEKTQGVVLHYEATFTKQTAKLRISMVKKSGTWLLQEFKIE